MEVGVGPYAEVFTKSQPLSSVGNGLGCTYRTGDPVTIASEKLGALQNTVVLCHDAPSWKFGMTALMRDLAVCGLL